MGIEKTSAQSQTNYVMLDVEPYKIKTGKFVYNPDSVASTPVFSLPPLPSDRMADARYNCERASIFAGRAVNVHDTTPTQSQPTTQAQAAPKKLKPGLFKGKLAGQEALVEKLCEKYNVPVDIIAAIIGLESGWGTSNLAVNHNNFGGYRAAGDLGKNKSGYGYFSTIEKGLEAMIKNISTYPQRFSDVKAINYENLDAIARHYCNSNWAVKIREVYNTRVQRYLA